MRRDETTCLVLFLFASCAGSAPPPPDLIAHLERWSHGPSILGSESEPRSVDPGSEAAPRAFDAADGIDLREAEVLCRLLGPRSREARAEAGISAALAANAGWANDPRLEFDVEHILDSVPEPWVLGASLGFEIPLSGRLARERERTAADHEAALAAVDRASWEDVHALRADWIRWLATFERLGAETAFLERLEEIAALAGRLAESGSIRRADARLFAIEIVARKVELLALEAERGRLEAAIKTRIGLAPLAPAALVRSSVAPELAGSAEERLAALREHNVAVAEARARREASARRFREETAKRLPDLSVSPGIGEDEGVDRALLGISIPLPLWNRNRSAIAAARARLAADDERLLVALEQQAQFLARSEFELATARARRELIEREALPRIREQVAELRALADLGELSSLQILDALMREVATRRAWIDADEAERLATNSIAETLGPPRATGAGAGELP
jgi:cobalt-zinc-cadmium efflux system outer membrane protein